MNLTSLEFSSELYIPATNDNNRAACTLERRLVTLYGTSCLVFGALGGRLTCIVKTCYIC
jgi:hypothetical protein